MRPVVHFWLTAVPHIGARVCRDRVNTVFFPEFDFQLMLLHCGKYTGTDCGIHVDFYLQRGGIPNGSEEEGGEDRDLYFTFYVPERDIMHLPDSP